MPDVSGDGGSTAADSVPGGAAVSVGVPTVVAGVVAGSALLVTGCRTVIATAVAAPEVRSTRLPERAPVASSICRVIATVLAGGTE